MRSIHLLVAIGWLAGPLAAQQVQVKSVTPTVEFGGLNDDPNLELVAVKRAVMTANGDFVVVNGRPAEVRVFDHSGRFLRRLGRPGEGPGEFRSGIDIRPWPGDSVLTYSSGTRRWMLFSIGGKLLREWPVDSAHPHVDRIVLERAAFVRSWMPGSRGCPYPFASRLKGELSAQISEVLSDPAGRIWRHDATRPRIWHVHDSSGRFLFDLGFPEGLRIQQFIGDKIVAVRQDEDGADHLMVFKLSLPPGRSPAPSRCPPPEGSRKMSMLIGLAAIKTDIRNLMAAGETLRSDLGRYPRTAGEVEKAGLLHLSLDNQLHVLASNDAGWSYVVGNKEMTAFCLTSIGEDALPGWPVGRIGCWAAKGR